MSAPAKKTVELFYDVLSPYSWIAFEVLCRYQNKWAMDLKLRPFLLGGIMGATGNRPPMMVPAKGQYMQKDLHRLVAHFKIPMNQPEDPVKVLMEKGSLKAQRFLTAVSLSQPEKTEDVSREMWMRVWNRDEDITEPQSLREAAKKAGLTDDVIDKLLEGIQDPKVKERLTENTTTAVDHGAFGAPIIVAHVKGKEEMIFGSDRFHILADLLGEKYVGPLIEYSKVSKL